ncbi:CopG family transcriptional regulator [Alcaligenes aquatilis]|uniref:CopG family transcriptional regulator n=1 Tax=Alcaligenes faecalis TaxID=511 RepID=A0AB33CVS1_ALCFA|nr:MULTISPECIES: DUF411 domain-containing protein [Alcaligenes]ASR90695.1 CopG family transcriptional regulator [Alcaligenes faecalis]QXR35361.1 CopG family transcriptional regulator [Alcaligenes aquatilis]
MIKPLLLTASLMVFSSVALAQGSAITMYQDPNCGCCGGWAQHMRDEGFEVKEVKVVKIQDVKRLFKVPEDLASCHTAMIEETGQLIEGHVPAKVVKRMMNDGSVRGVAAPGMPVNSPGMGQMDGNLVTVDFDGRPYSRD